MDSVTAEKFADIDLDVEVRPPKFDFKGWPERMAKAAAAQDVNWFIEAVTALISDVGVRSTESSEWAKRAHSLHRWGVSIIDLQSHGRENLQSPERIP